ncbi:MAG: hypothetical protein H0V30_11560 [Chitinophagaceae bacterium]|jgi:hypothetical protein|nr:hypothetical protein [Chitinophagaceae bacterium]
MELEIILRIILEDSTPGVDYGLQEGKGVDFKTVETKRGHGGSLQFECRVRVKSSAGNPPVFLGPFAQGPRGDRFIYIDIGTFAGQKDSCWSRRLKIPLTGITPEIIKQSVSDSNMLCEAFVPGSEKGGGPNCGTVKPFNGWKLRRSE